ncbi:MAG: TIGR02147 family protein, partial [Bdellovibrionota bacterium]
FARDLNLSPSTLSEILNEKVGISTVKSRDLVKRLKLPAPHDDHFCDLVAGRHARNQKQKKEAQIRATSRMRTANSQLSLDRFKQIADWYHYAILELVDLSPKYHSIEALSKALKLSKVIVAEATHRLMRVGELELTETHWKTVNSVSNAGEQVPSDALKQFHTQVLKKAQEAIYDQTIEEREFQASFFCIDSADLPAFKADMDKMRKELIKKYGHKPDKNKVYSLSMQFMRLHEEAE